METKYTINSCLYLQYLVFATSMLLLDASHTADQEQLRPRELESVG